MLIMKANKQRGYTLVELSISLTIIAVLLSSGLAVFSKTDEAKRFRVTVERQTKIQNALQTYIYENKHLPCPAPGDALESQESFGTASPYNTPITFTSAASADNSFNGGYFYGITAGSVIAVSGFTDPDNNGYFTVSNASATKIIVSGATELDDEAGTFTIMTHNCNGLPKDPPLSDLTNETGMVPVKTLKLADEYAYDGWNRKFTYRIAAGMGNATDFADTKYKGDIGIIDINGNEKTDKDKPAPRNFGAAYVLISHGPNGQGAWSRNTTTVSTAPAATSRELENTNHSVNKIYLQAERTTRTRGNDAGFDDIVVFKRKSDVVLLLKGRSPVSISNNACTNARAIIAGGEAGVSASNLLGAFKNSSASNALIADQIYATAKSLKVLCENQATGCAINPLSVSPSTLQLWLDGNDPYGSGNLPKNGASIATWVDKSGNGNDASQSNTTFQPTFSYGAKNRKSVMHFADATPGEKHFTIQAPLLASITTDMTAFVVVNITDSNDTVIMMARDSENTINSFNIRSPKLGSQIGVGLTHVNLFDFGNINQAGRIYSEWEWGVDRNRFYIYTFKVSPTGMVIYRDGIDVENSATASQIGFTSNLMDIGAHNNSSSGNPTSVYNGIIGDVAEIIIYNSALSNTDRDNMEKYLKLKWGLAATACPDQFKL